MYHPKNPSGLTRAIHLALAVPAHVLTIAWCALLSAGQMVPASRRVATRPADVLAGGKKLLALYLVAVILILIAVLVMIFAFRIPYKREPRKPSQEPMKDLWFEFDEEKSE